MKNQAGALHCAESEKWLAAEREARVRASVRSVTLGDLGYSAAMRMPLESWLRFVCWWSELPKQRLAA